MDTPTEKNLEVAAAVDARLRKGESLRSIARSMGETYQALQYHRRRAGSAPLREARTRGEQHASWTGGEYIDQWGYRMVRAPNRGRANPYVPEHVLVAEASLGRRLERGEVVHHIDCNKTNNDPANLFACSRSQHKKLHAELEAVAALLFRDGLVRWTGDGYEVV